MNYSHESVPPDEIPKLLATLLDGSIKFIEFIVDQNPSEYNTRMLQLLEMIRDSLEKKDIPLPKKAMVEFEEQLIEFLITWHPKIESQCREFYRVYNQIYKNNENLFSNPNEHPLYLIIKNLERYERASKIYENIVKNYDFKSITEIDFYSYFFAVIATSEAMEYYYYKSFVKYVNDYKIEDVNIEEIFTINNTWKDKYGKNISEIRAMRNALAHFNFTTKYDEENVNSAITFFAYPDKLAESRTYTSNEITDFLGEYRYLLQTFENILFIMFIFKTIQRYFSADSR